MRWLKSGFAIVFLAATPVAAIQPEWDGCLDLAQPNSKATVSGLLTTQLFAGPPNFESIANGDAEEWALILELPRRICASDGEFIEPDMSFDRVHLSSHDPHIRAVLNAATGRNIIVMGAAFGAQTGHHHAPLVLFVEEVSVR